MMNHIFLIVDEKFEFEFKKTFTQKELKELDNLGLYKKKQ